MIKKRKNPFILTQDNLKRWIYLNFLNYNDFLKAAEDAVERFDIPFLYKGYAVEYLTVLFRRVNFYWHRYLSEHKSQIPKLKGEFKAFWKNFVFNRLYLEEKGMIVHDQNGKRTYNFEEFWNLKNQNISVKKNPLTKVIFLDHDGVMVLRDNDGDLDNLFSPKCVKVLNEIIKATHCEIVVSSDWRIHYDLRALQEIYKNAGVLKIPFSVTPDLYTKNMNMNDLENLRTFEIITWLKNHPVDRWCAVDDMELNLPFHVQTDNGIKGMTGPGIKEKIIAILNR